MGREIYVGKTIETKVKPNQMVVSESNEGRGRRAGERRRKRRRRRRRKREGRKERRERMG